MLRNFLGREPQQEPFLEELGLSGGQQQQQQVQAKV